MAVALRCNSPRTPDSIEHLVVVCGCNELSMLVTKLDDETVGGCDIDQLMTLRHEALQEASRESYARVGVGCEENARATVPICPQGFQQRNAAVKRHDALAAARASFDKGWGFSP